MFKSTQTSYYIRVDQIEKEARDKEFSEFPWPGEKPWAIDKVAGCRIQ